MAISHCSNSGHPTSNLTESSSVWRSPSNNGISPGGMARSAISETPADVRIGWLDSTTEDDLDVRLCRKGASVIFDSTGEGGGPEGVVSDKRRDKEDPPPAWPFVGLS